MVLVPKGSSEYEAVAEKFTSVDLVSVDGKRVTSKSNVLASSLLSVFRIQNQHLYEKYSSTRSHLVSTLGKQGKTGTEHVLWHGPGTVRALEGITMR